MVEGCFCPLDRAPQSPGYSSSFLRIFLIPTPITLDRGLASCRVGLCCVGDLSPGRQAARKGPGLASLLPRVGRAPAQSSPCHMAGWHQWVQTSLPCGCPAARQAAGRLFLGLTLRVQTRGQSGHSLPPASKMPGHGRRHVGLHPPGQSLGCSQSWRPGKGVGQTFSCG